MSSEIFQTYLQEYTTLSLSLTEKLAQLQTPSLPQDQRKLIVSQAERELEECDEIVHSLEMEIMSLPLNQRSALQPKLKECKAESEKYRKELANVKQNHEREALLARTAATSALSADPTIASMDQRARLLQGTDQLQEGSRKLEEARRIALETEQIGISTLETLGQQREQILRTRNRLNEADGFVATSQRVLKGMQRRLVQNKFMSAFIIILLIALIILVVWIKWF